MYLDILLGLSDVLPGAGDGGGGGEGTVPGAVDLVEAGAAQRRHCLLREEGLEAVLEVGGGGGGFTLTQQLVLNIK